MKSLFAATVFTVACAAAIAQPQKPTYAYYEGLNLSLGLTQNTTETTGASNQKSTGSMGVAKVNYTFALTYPAKLGLSATMDLKSSRVSNDEFLSVIGPSEISIEPGILLLSNSLLYGKLGSYSSRYESGTNPTRNLSGISYGVGIKHYIQGQNFVQAEWTERQADDNGAGLSGIKFRQRAISMALGFNF